MDKTSDWRSLTMEVWSAAFVDNGCFVGVTLVLPLISTGSIRHKQYQIIKLLLLLFLTDIF